MGCQMAKLIDAPKKARKNATYYYLGTLIDENRLNELELPPAAIVAVYQKMIEAGWV